MKAWLKRNLPTIFKWAGSALYSWKVKKANESNNTYTK